MKINISFLSCLLLSFTCLLSSQIINGASHHGNTHKTYIVYMGDPLKVDHASASSLHRTMLHGVIGSKASTSLLYSYRKSFNGFAAKLTEEEKHRVAKLEGVVSVFPNRKLQVHTTRSWDFMGLTQQVNRTALESDIIIGVLDTGISPESDSFRDQGLSPIPKKWKGSCQSSSNFTCNKKIIGAQYFRSAGFLDINDVKSPRDEQGHGTHVASIAAGGYVSNANLTGLANGTARGGVPSARIAVYKVCWSDGCNDVDILAAFDEAIADGVDIISISVGGAATDYFQDSIAIGSFHAMKNRILTSASAGNSGNEPGRVTNVSPWILSVAASTYDRKFLTKVQLGNGLNYEGVSVNTFTSKKGKYPLVYGGDVPNVMAGFSKFDSRYCRKNSLDSKLVKGKIVLCDELSNGESVFLSSAAGTIMRDAENRDNTKPFPLPATFLGVDDGDKAFKYIRSTRNPTATIFKSVEAVEKRTPYVASFSSRGPNSITPEILKPDITAPGVGILAAWSPAAPLSGINGDNRRVLYNIKSGTSMSCPHATAVAAYIKSFFPSWSPAAIKSALMTTAFPLNSTTNPDGEFAYGAGHIDPIKALNPGLVYDADEIDYVTFLCAQGYNTTTLRSVTGDNSTCKKTTGASGDLNLPSFAIPTAPLQTFSHNFTRRVTNVGSPVSKYSVKITAPPSLKIRIEPSILSFTSIGQKLTFKVQIAGQIDRAKVSASFVWDDGKHKVRSPIVVYDSST
ncbi:hypothetical protein DCAR_0313261 [Daucus carota subsp. sativus]|uniref:Cucumisin-like n=1 Tax=Daucus carota subsp. sativus TaxID=79200 RepID=A0AAF0WSF9_DAUCS|nr:PREDICTED: cucumisin-like [Daucus carota subsp. sativus]WOG93971.1 hypothetical protein DCAR_0313261 [Daucus carota subsp. sativus]